MTARKPSPPSAGRTPAGRAASARTPSGKATPARTPSGRANAPSRGGKGAASTARSRPGKAGARAARRVAASPKTRKAVRKATRGDRPYLFGLVVLVAVLLSMAWSPVRGLTAGHERIEQLTASREQLQQEVDRLEDRKDQLMDPQELELIAREEYGLVKPGEIPYVVVTPEPEPDLRAGAAEPRAAAMPWYRRLWSAVTDLWE